PYQGHASGEASIFFAAHYAFSRAHLKDVAWMWFWGCGAVIPAVLAIGCVNWWRRRPRSDATLPPRAAAFAATVMVVYIAYAWFMIPKKGPNADLDLFFTSYFAAAFFAGVLGDMVMRKPSQQLIVLSAALANVAAVYPVLRATGLPAM